MAEEARQRRGLRQEWRSWDVCRTYGGASCLHACPGRPCLPSFGRCQRTLLSLFPITLTSGSMCSSGEGAWHRKMHAIDPALFHTRHDWDVSGQGAAAPLPIRRRWPGTKNARKRQTNSKQTSQLHSRSGSSSGDASTRLRHLTTLPCISTVRHSSSQPIVRGIFRTILLGCLGKHKHLHKHLQGIMLHLGSCSPPSPCIWCLSSHLTWQPPTFWCIYAIVFLRRWLIR